MVISTTEAISKVQEEIWKTTILRYFDLKEPILLQFDAGIGAALLQKRKPVAFASKTLSVPETRYSNIEREMLAIIFGWVRFHHYVWGYKVTIQTDHKLL